MGGTEDGGSRPQDGPYGPRRHGPPVAGRHLLRTHAPASDSHGTLAPHHEPSKLLSALIDEGPIHSPAPRPDRSMQITPFGPGSFSASHARSRRGLVTVLLVGLLSAGTVSDASAQSLLSVEVSPRVTMPVSTFSDQGAERALGVTGAVFLRVFSPLSVYGGWDRTSFDCDGCGGAGSLQVSGPYGGLEAQLAPDRRIRPWFRAGFARRSTETDIPAATLESEQSWAIHAGMGVQVSVMERLAVTTGARFETLDPAVDLGSDATELGTPVSYVSFDLGVRFHILP